MFGSQAIETAIGLTAMFFVIAAAASAIVEAISRVVSKRAKNLEVAIAAMLTGDADIADTAVGAALAGFQGTSMYKSALRGSGKSLFRKRFKRPAYLSSKAFVDALSELLTDPAKTTTFATLPAGLQQRLRPILLSTQGEALQAKASLEQWFDETMSRLEGSYKRWASLWIFCIALVIVLSANASTFKVAERLYRDPATREAVADAATSYSQQPADVAGRIKSVADATDTLEELKLPIGWDDQTKNELRWKGKDSDGNELDFGHKLGVFAALIAGWIATALLVMLGAPFWFEVLTKLVSLRGTGAKPPEAKDDSGSHTALAVKQLGAGRAAAGADLIQVDSTGTQTVWAGRSVDMDLLLRRMLGQP